MTRAITVRPQTAPEQKSVENFISQAIKNGAPVETIERLLAMRRELKAEAAKEAFDQAMSAFQSECPVIKKTKSVSTNGGKKAYSYAPIESIVKQVKSLIEKHGFSYKTTIELTEKGVKAVVRVTHELGHSEDSPMEVPLGSKTDIMSNSQVTAAASTFAKRYAFCNAFGILTGDEDNDGADTGTTTPPAAPKGAEKKTAEAPKDMFAEATRMIDAAKNTGALFNLQDRILKSDKFTKAQKQELDQHISRRVDALDSNEKTGKK